MPKAPKFMPRGRPNYKGPLAPVAPGIWKTSRHSSNEDNSCCQFPPAPHPPPTRGKESAPRAVPEPPREPIRRAPQAPPRDRDRGRLIVWNDIKR
ncbi:hypothetical protein EVAR_91252_1 [Eumeta japonica]|uniref:Uncharacterized protein n=1 Tax=Eumeta variegata TaxID=151549 RepID=A0A4C2A1Z4_EUMVA|nr:hypothetical protein EVAR_91252_1 [Eumeta japonica]